MSGREVLHRRIYIYLLIVLAFSLPISMFLSSVAQFALFFNWLAEADFRSKWTRLKQNKAFWIFMCFFFLHIVALFWSEDLVYGLKDVKIKLPLFVIPFIVISSEAVSVSEIRKVLLSFIVANIVASFASVLALIGVIPVDITNFREASLFIGHIRFSLMVVLSIFFALWLLYDTKNRLEGRIRLLCYFALFWFPVFLFILRSLSGIVVLLILVFYLSMVLVSRISHRKIRLLVQIFIVLIPVSAVLFVVSSVHRFYDFDKKDVANIDTHTVNGNRYVNHIHNEETENGHYVWLHVCPEELEKEWERVSDFPYKGNTENGDVLRFTLIRYLTSLDLRKDSVGIHQLSSEDIQAIERGVANHIFLNKFSFYSRIYEVIWEFDRYHLGYSANDKSVIQRYFYVQAGLNIISENLLIGVGTGDVQAAFEDYYTKIKSPLKEDRRRRAHNQFITFAVTFGLIGFLLCMVLLLLPVFLQKRWPSFLAIVFLITMGLSMLNEDTLENTPGVLMFSLFYSIFILLPYNFDDGRMFK